MSATAYFDGACEPRNPGGTGAWGFIIYAEDGTEITSGYGTMRARPTMTNNVAEYAAAGAALKAYQGAGIADDLVLRGDSMLVVMQMSGEWAARRGAYLPVRQRLLDLVAECTFGIAWEWVRRDKNSVADALSVKGLVELGIKRRNWKK